jgi:hypothetical protein
MEAYKKEIKSSMIRTKQMNQNLVNAEETKSESPRRRRAP